jgi:site-specific recombinase XerD
MKNFESFLAPLFQEYCLHREGLGYNKRSHRGYLLSFDRYLKKEKADWSCLQPAFFLALRADLHMESRSANRILSTVRVFFQFLVRRGYVTENPLQDIPSLRENIIIPFLFSPEQIEQLLCAVCTHLRREEKNFLLDLALYMTILLMARCGLRISEPLRLLRHHYRRDEGTIHIEKTKFKKDRLIPIPQSAITAIENYLCVRRTLSPRDQNPYLLAGRQQRPLRDEQVRSLFRQTVKEIGLDQPRRVIGHVNFSHPTPHSLRHSFAVNTLIAIKERGESAHHALPILAAYMGHSEYKHTTKYLKVIDAATRQGLADFVSAHRKSRT